MATANLDILKTYDWGVDRKVLDPIEAAMIKAGKDEAARGELEESFIAILPTDLSRDAKDYLCRKLMSIGSAKCVPTVAVLLPDEQLSHMARFALERIPPPEAGAALRDSLPKVSDQLKVGVLSSLGARGDVESVALIAELLGNQNEAVACAAATALGAIANDEAIKALNDAKPASPKVAVSVADARLKGAERLLSDGKKAQALVIYRSLVKDAPGKQFKVAATRGLVASASSK